MQNFLFQLFVLAIKQICGARGYDENATAWLVTMTIVLGDRATVERFFVWSNASTDFGTQSLN